MIRSTPPIGNKIIERIPQTIRLRSGLYLNLRNRRDVGEFWHIFTSSEYMSLVPELISLKMDSGVLVDCGASIGLFTFLIEQLSRCGILPWKDVFYTVVEPGDYNYAQLEKNMQENFSPNRYQICKGLVGHKKGEANFYESKHYPYSSSLTDRKEKKGKKHQVPFVDLSNFLEKSPCFVKMDIEGGEFLALEAYKEYWQNVVGLIIEWHAEMGDVSEAEKKLLNSGLKKVKRSWDNGDRLVDLYLRM